MEMPVKIWGISYSCATSAFPCLGYLVPMHMADQEIPAIGIVLHVPKFLILKKKQIGIIMCLWRLRLDTRNFFFLQKSGQVLKQAAQ